MKKIVHLSPDRGSAEHGWLHTRFSFSFADWYEPTRMGFGALRVLNDDVVEAGHGFGAHQHDNMEIITIVMEGIVTHQDSMGNNYAVPAGDIQVMSAGTGVVHSERNNSPNKRLALFQIWIEPKERNIAPRYAQKSFLASTRKNNLTLLVSPHVTPDTLSINQDAHTYYGDFEAGTTLHYKYKDAKNGAYIFVVEGVLAIGETHLGVRDAIGIVEANVVDISFIQRSKILIFEVPMQPFWQELF